MWARREDCSRTSTHALPALGSDEEQVAAHVVERDGALVIAEFRVFPAAEWRVANAVNLVGVRPRGSQFKVGEWDANDDVPSGGVTARLLRHIPVGEIVRTARSGIANEVDEYGLTENLTRAVRRKPTKQGSRPGRAGRPDRFYAEIAARMCAP